MRDSRLFPTIAVLLNLVCAVTADEPKLDNRETAPQPTGAANAKSRATVIAAVSRLGDAKFDVREDATRQLGHAGMAAIDPLLAAAEGENLEVTWRAVKALGRILDTDDAAQFEAAEGALERLEASTNSSAARRAAAALETQPTRRWKRGLARFEAAGGWTIVRRGDDPGGPAAMQNTEVPLPTYLVIGPGWKAGAAGLVNVKRMDSFLQARNSDRRIGVYVVDGSDVAPQAIEEMQHSLRQMEFASRGRARLAVSFSFDLRGRAEVSGVEPDAADLTKSNLKKGDVIVKYDGEALIDFDHLTRITRRHEVGDKLPVEVRRNGEPAEFEIELTGWKKPEVPVKETNPKR